MRLRTALALLALAALCLWGTPSADAKLIEDIEVTMEPSRATVGDELTLTVVVTHPSGSQITGPDAPGQFAPLELIEARPPESRDAPGGVRETRFVYVLAAFETGILRPPLLPFRTEGESGSIETVRPPAVTIESVLPADGDRQLRDITGPLQASAGTPRWIWAALLMAGFVGGSALVVALARLPVLRPPPPVAARLAVAPDQAARGELDRIAGAGLRERGELKEYYRRLASCLRGYLSRRFEIEAVAMTPQELEGRLEALGIDPWPARLAVNLLQQCEAVQFGRYAPAGDRAEADLAAAYEVVELTRPQESEREREEASASP